MSGPDLYKLFSGKDDHESNKIEFTRRLSVTISPFRSDCQLWDGR